MKKMTVKKGLLRTADVRYIVLCNKDLTRLPFQRGKESRQVMDLTLQQMSFQVSPT